jgi:hypothetical protein
MQQLDAPPNVKKKFCLACCCFVNPHGHSERCVPVAATQNSIDRLRARAWIGDAAHTFDVRCYIISLGKPRREYQLLAEQYTTATHQAVYLRQRGYEDIDCRGDNDTLLSEAFEAAYFGAFRLKYISDTFGDYPGHKLPHEISTDFGPEVSDRALDFRLNKLIVVITVICAVIFAVLLVVVWK